MLPPRPEPIPLPDRHQLERLNTLYTIAGSASAGGWTGRLLFPIRKALARVLSRQQAFNAVVVEHLNRDAVVGIAAHEASARTIDWVEATMVTAMSESRAVLDDLRRHREALLARERRSESAVAALAASQDELRTAISVLQQATQNLKREVTRLAETGVAVATVSAGAPPLASGPSNQLDALDSHKYVGFEDQFRGSSEDIRRRVAEYLPVFEGTSDVLDVGCGRGEFLALLREHGIGARGIDINVSMVEACRQRGLDASDADALEYLRAQPDGSLGGLFAAQVVEHLEPRYLTRLLDAAFDKLRPGAPIVLETINPACWFAFFESYIRDPTHVRPIHPDTLKYLLVASGFQHVDIRYRAPYPENEKLQPLPVSPAGSRQQDPANVGATHAWPLPAEWVDTINANVERINRLLFTWLDYAALGRRP